MIVVDVVAAVHLERQRTVGSSPAVDAHAFVFAVLQCALAMSGAAILAAGCDGKRTKHTCDTISCGELTAFGGTLEQKHNDVG